MILKAESLNHPSSETTNALPLNPHETKKAVVIKNTGKKKCRDSEDENFFKIKFYKMAAGRDVFRQCLEEPNENAVKVIKDENIKHSRISTGCLK